MTIAVLGMLVLLCVVVVFSIIIICVACRRIKRESKAKNKYRQLYHKAYDGLLSLKMENAQLKEEILKYKEKESAEQ